MNKLDHNVLVAQALQVGIRHGAMAPELVEALAREALKHFTLRATCYGPHEIVTTWDGNAWYTCWSRDDHFIESDTNRDALEALAVHEDFLARAHRGMRKDAGHD